MNELIAARKRSGLSQSEAAQLIGISRRSYQSYENDEQKQRSYKFDYFVTLLNNESKLDEEHGILSFAAIKNTVSKILNKYDAKTCYLFGSYAKNKANPKSDVDLLIDTSVTGIHFYGLVEELRVALKKKVDLLDLNQVLINKELLSEILKDGIKIYG